MHLSPPFVKNEYSVYYVTMPKVTDAHRESRREQILHRGVEVLFPQRIPQHIDGRRDPEAGLSAGAVYLYFRSKDDIIVAVATQVFGGIQGRLLQFADAGPAAEPGRDRRFPGPATGAGAGGGAGRSLPAAARRVERGHPQSRPRRHRRSHPGRAARGDHRHVAAMGRRPAESCPSRPTSSRRSSSPWSRASSCRAPCPVGRSPTTTEPRWRPCSPRPEWADVLDPPTAGVECHPSRVRSPYRAEFSLP